MAYSVNWITKVISIPTTDLTLISGTRYSLDMADFLNEIRRLEWESTEGLWALAILEHTNTRYDFASANYAPFDELLNGYTVQFTGIADRVDLLGSNNDIIDVLIATGVSIVPSNSAGLQIVETGDGTAPTVIEIADAVWDEDLSPHNIQNSAATTAKSGTYRIGNISLNVGSPYSGTGWPVGTHFNPVNNLTDALTMMFYGNVDDLVLISSVTVEALHDISGIVMRTIGKMGINVILSTGCTANQTTFNNVNLSGIITIGNQLLLNNCSVGNLENFRGIMNNVVFGQGSEITLSGWAEIIQGTAGGDPTNEVEIKINGASLNMSHWTGNLKLTGKTGIDRTVINCTSGNIIIDSTCVAGTIQLLGTGILEADNSGAGCHVDLDGFINSDTIAEHVWNAEDALVIRKILENKVTKSDDIITIYEDNGTTIWRRYNLANGGRVQL